MEKIRKITASLASLVVALLLSGQAGAAADKAFVGSEACKTCHAKQYETWKNTYHSKMVRKKDEGRGLLSSWALNDATPCPNAAPPPAGIGGKLQEESQEPAAASRSALRFAFALQNAPTEMDLFSVT